MLGRVLCLLVVVMCASAEVRFNRDIRPILSDRCFPCHGPDAANRKTALRFDVEAGAKPAIVAGDAAKSPLMQRVISTNKTLRMPPAYLGHDRLPDKEIELLRQWIDQGAQWEKHWSLIPPKRVKVPGNGVDYYVRARLEREGWKPSPETARATLIRRLSLDLTGLPPTPEEVDAFLKDSSVNAYEKQVDRLLASPRYAERMAMRWLEVARYADTNGYQTDGIRDMYRWRDWVIGAFARNMPFDRFTVEQLAGDLLPNATLDQKIATGFLRNHRTTSEGGIVPEEFRVEYVAERAETTATVWLGMTFGCARCHDHKYDPISQKDFYRLFAFFNNVPEKGQVYNFGNEEPMIKAPTTEMSRKLENLDRELADAEREWERVQPQLAKDQRKWERNKPGEWSITRGLILHLPMDGAAAPLESVEGKAGTALRFDGAKELAAGAVAGFDYLDPFSIGAWIKPEAGDGAIVTKLEDYFEAEGYGLYLIGGKLQLVITKRFTDIGLRVETESPVTPNQWQHVLAVYDGTRYATGTALYINGVEQKLKVLFDDLNYPLGNKEPLRIGAGGGKRFRGAIDEVVLYRRALTPKEALAMPVLETVPEIAAMKPERRTKAQAAKLRLAFLEESAPAALKRLEEARLARKRFYGSIPTVMVMKESPGIRDTFLLKRGAYDAPGEKVTAGVPAVLPAFGERPENRLGLAQWLTDPEHPLTARVTVNRYWQMLFGQGLVKTVEDFGSQGEWPVQMELLDWLAAEFVASGWDVKGLLKTIVMSGTYRQSSRVTPELLERDPENRLLARGARFRLPADVVRDQALAVAGLLVEKTGGPSVKPYQPPGLWQELAGGSGYKQGSGEDLYRRSLYTYWRRTVAPPSMITFDAPNRETCSVRAVRTNTPLQALNLMNDVAYVEASRALAVRGGIGEMFRIVLSREPSAAEFAALQQAHDGFLSYYRANPGEAERFLSHGESPRDKSLDAAGHAARAAVASLILNLDEAITKE